MAGSSVINNSLTNFIYHSPNQVRYYFELPEYGNIHTALVQAFNGFQWIEVFIINKTNILV
jgi:hypothetical protein